MKFELFPIVYTDENCNSVECKINHYNQINDILRNV